MNRNILFDIVPAKGHIHATLKMATLLKQAGHRVTYALPMEYWADTAKHGFETANEVPVPKLLKSGFTQSGKELSELEEYLCASQPDLVMLDEQNSYKAIYYQILKIKVIFFISKPDTRKIERIPPFTSYYLPKPGVISDLWVKVLWAKRIMKVKLEFIRIKIQSGKLDRYATCKTISKKNRINFDELFEYQRSFGYGIKGVPRLIISPKAFDFPHEEKDGVYRVGPLVDIARERKIEHPRYEALLRSIDQLKNAKSGFIVYVSIGTVSRYDLKRCTKFFLRMVKVAKTNPNDLFVISTGKYFDVNLLLPRPANFMVFESVPQVDLLQKSDIMITHGGMNSITECVFCGMPMLVYPLSRNWDQPGNSARLVFHGLGLRGRIERDSPQTITRKLKLLKQRHSQFKQNVLAMREKFEEQNNS
ncbi:MAG: glycosyltransferase, partial [Ignavibacteria bacterium]|nr:glycosyltransferase [Ignavibacteria bacterium]